MPDIEKVYNLIRRRAAEVPKKKMYSSNIQIELETIKLDYPKPEEPSPRKKLRTCCLEK